MNSKLDPTRTLSNISGVISVLANKSDHALLAIETFNDEDYALRIADFVPEDRGGDLSSMLLNTSFSIEQSIKRGKTRCYEKLGAQNQTRSEILSSLQLINQYCMRSWLCTNSNLRSLIELINREVDEPELAPDFCILGFKKSGERGHNCITWAEAKLAYVGLTINLSLIAQSADSLSADPVLHTSRCTMI